MDNKQYELYTKLKTFVYERCTDSKNPIFDILFISDKEKYIKAYCTEKEIEGFNLEAIRSAKIELTDEQKLDFIRLKKDVKKMTTLIKEELNSIVMNDNEPEEDMLIKKIKKDKLNKELQILEPLCIIKDYTNAFDLYYLYNRGNGRTKFEIEEYTKYKKYYAYSSTKDFNIENSKDTSTKFGLSFLNVIGLPAIIYALIFQEFNTSGIGLLFYFVILLFSLPITLIFNCLVLNKAYVSYDDFPVKYDNNNIFAKDFTKGFVAGTIINKIVK